MRRKRMKQFVRPIWKHTAVDDADAKRLYELIWKRTMASQMADAELEKTIAKIGISTNKAELTAQGEVLKFDGFLKVYHEDRDDDDDEDEDDRRCVAAVQMLVNNCILKK